MHTGQVDGVECGAQSRYGWGCVGTPRSQGVAASTPSKTGSANARRRKHGCCAGPGAAAPGKSSSSDNSEDEDMDESKNKTTTEDDD